MHESMGVTLPGVRHSMKLAGDITLCSCQTSILRSCHKVPVDSDGNQSLGHFTAEPQVPVKMLIFKNVLMDMANYWQTA